MLGSSKQPDDVNKLPPHLSERVRVIQNAAIGPGGDFVLYWMHHAVRSHENPALDTALYVAAHLKIPALVYQGLGLFDRLFKPERPVIGSLRPRSTKDHAKRLNMAAYTAKVKGPVFGEPLKIAVIGSGLSGPFAARTLLDHGHKVQVFEKRTGRRAALQHRLIPRMPSIPAPSISRCGTSACSDTFNLGKGTASFNHGKGEYR